MATAYASRIIEAPVEAVWAEVRDFDALSRWNPAIAPVTIENGLRPDVVGCIRSFGLADGTPVREKLLALDDSRYRFSYDFQTPAFPVENYVAEMELIPVANGDTTFVQWSATFDEAPADCGKYVDIVSNAVFAKGLESLATTVAGRQAPADATRWQA